ncbi:hypothetical protein B0O99DRAFT_692879 [Bisporella sp. PMI_857]|nr:hypothetical protein B0O99DRAFT_692879 [Bisporella sp. PMI_857]
MAHSPSSNTSPLTFLSLPREIRDAIYSITLCSSSPITVWKGECVYEPQFSTADPTEYDDSANRTYIWRRLIDQSAAISSLSALVTNLLFCTSIISQEAAEVFYKKNTFFFLGEHNWDPVLLWLQTIGAKNRNHLSSLAVDVYKPDQVWQRFNGERVQQLNGSTKEKIYPRSPHLGVRMRPFKYGLVDSINPAVQTIFQLLGQRTSTQQLKVAFNICDEYPGQGSIIEDGVQYPENGWHSMDLPNLVEKFRTIYAWGPGPFDAEPTFDVLWRGECHSLLWRKQDETVSRIVILDHLQNIENHGWEIDLQLMKEDASKWTPHDDSADIPTYTLRRKKLDEPLMGDDPNPYSGIFIRPGSEEADMEKVTGWYS